MDYSPKISIPKPSSGDVNQIFEEMTKRQRGPPSDRREDYNPRSLRYDPNIPVTKMGHSSSRGISSRAPDYDPYIPIPGTSQRRPPGAVMSTTNMKHPSSGRSSTSGYVVKTFMADYSSGRDYTKVRPSGSQRPLNDQRGPSDQRGHPRRALHQGVQCDGCGINPIVGIRYKCRTCPNYDLCRNCSGTRHLHHQFLVLSKNK